jgi:hypothetical protein
MNFFLTLAFCDVGQTALAMSGGPQECGDPLVEEAALGRVKAPIGSHVQTEFSPWNSFPHTPCPRCWSCLVVLLVIHHAWLPSQLLWAMSGLGWTIPIFKVLRSGCSCFNEQQIALMPGQRAGLIITNGTLCGATCSALSTFDFWCSSGGSALLLWPLIPMSLSQLQEW